jgi:kinesin family protein C1
LSTNQSNLQSQLSLAKAAESSANRELRESNDELLREKALWARDSADLERERRDRIRLEGEIHALQAERTRLLRDSEDLDRERRTRSNLERELEETREEVRKERKDGREREEELRREVMRIGREERERAEELEREQEGRKREKTENESLKVGTLPCIRPSVRCRALTLCPPPSPPAQAQISELNTSTISQSTQLAALQNQYAALTHELASSHTSYSSLSSTTALQLEETKKDLAEAQQKVREAETERRKLHNIIQELKGNIRVFCRVRPAGASTYISSGENDTQAQISYSKGDQGQQMITVHQSSQSALGENRDQAIPFSFDKVFEPQATQLEVFEEIEGLTQSVLDGYNCCIFAYGQVRRLLPRFPTRRAVSSDRLLASQTGAGKSHTMEGGLVSSCHVLLVFLQCGTC